MCVCERDIDSVCKTESVCVGERVSEKEIESVCERV